MPRCAVNGAELYYELHGSGEPMLLVPGFTVSAAVFEPVLAAYARRFRCILFDNRGSGRTRAPARPTSMPELAADAAGLLAALGVDSAHVYGVSMGGMVAQELALRFPERVRGLVLGATTSGGPRSVRPAAGELSALASAVAGGRRRPAPPARRAPRRSAPTATPPSRPTTCRGASMPPRAKRRDRPGARR